MVAQSIVSQTLGVFRGRGELFDGWGAPIADLIPAQQNAGLLQVLSEHAQVLTGFEAAVGGISVFLWTLRV